MSKKRRMFDIEIPDDLAEETFPTGKVAEDVPKPSKRGPMATAINENAEALKSRQAAEDAIRSENDGLAHEYVRLKQAGLIVDLIALDDINTDKLVRDRRKDDDLELVELKSSIKAIGLSNPIQVERLDDGRFELVQGMRRLTAFRELLAETGDASYKKIPAGIMASGMDLQDMYRRMVDENLVRKDISFAEMAELARRYAADPATDCVDVDQAVAELFQSAAYSKRSNIRSFAEILDRLDKVLMYPHKIPRNLGLNLRKRINQTPELVAMISAELVDWSNRSADDELSLLRRYVAGEIVASELVKNNQDTRAAARKAKTTFQVSTGSGVAKCTASSGRLEVKLDKDFSAVDRRRLEAAVTEFLDRL